MSEPMTDLDWLAAARYPRADDDWTPSARTGRHAFREDPAETPIFNALSTGEWRIRQAEAGAPPPSRHAYGQPTRSRRPAPEPEPLTMPIPRVHAAHAPHVETARRAAFGAHALQPERRPERVREERPDRARREVTDSGRHHRRPSISSLL
ncbi:hypothetical protein BJF78_12645 [Pseudonocardia sp. CNS-139]|nr:hypothetical protein BJF78_12645 [Pseudonocardia sp. CNS-139]